MEHMKSTEDAIAFGIRATPVQITAMARRKREIQKDVKFLIKQGDLQEALDKAFEGQLLREATEAYYENH